MIVMSMMLEGKLAWVEIRGIIVILCVHVFCYVFWMFQFSIKQYVPTLGTQICTHIYMLSRDQVILN